MNTLSRSCLFLAVLTGGLVSASAAPFAPAREPEISGTYEDAGTIVAAPPGDPPAVVSLHALLVAEFSPGLARLLHDQTGGVRLTHTGGQLHAEILNRDGEVAWERVWRQGEDYGVQGARVVLRFKAARADGDDFVLLLETATAYKLLQIEVQRHTPTVLGPKVQPMGTYLFHRDE